MIDQEGNQVIRVTVRHVRAALHGCYPGARAFCRRHGLDIHQFIHGGLPVEQIEATGDAMAIKVAAKARQEAAGGQLGGVARAQRR